MESIKAVIICGGIGKRMHPLTADKALLKFSGTPLLIHQINAAMKAGIGGFIIITNPENNSEIQASLSKIGDARKPLGMADALMAASELIAGKAFILVSSNDVFDVSAYTTLLREYNSNKGYTVYIAARQVQNYFPGGYLVINRQNEISHIIEKPPQGQEPSNLVNIVLHLHTQPETLLEYLCNTTSSSDDVYENCIDHMIKDGHKMKAVQYDGFWQAIKYPWHILKVMDHFSQQSSKQESTRSHISNKAIIEGNVIIEDGVKIFEGAVIKGNSFIGRNTVIGTGALVRDSIIGDDCVVGYGTEIKHSYIGNKCWFHSNYIGDSVIEDDCSFGAGAITANFRLDESNIKVRTGPAKIDTETDKLGAIIGKGCRIGIHASLMPGIRIGDHSFIGSHVYLTDDIDANKKVIAEPNYRILPNDTKTDADKRHELRRKLTG
jgi:NDP-sugar pyrophosphorylase family protein